MPQSTHELLYEGKFLRMVRRDGWEYTERIACEKIACISPILIKDGQKHIVLIKEFRIPLQKYVIGLPAGLVGDLDDSEKLEDGALRELIEETGFSGRIRYVTHGPPSSGLSNEVIHFYMADKLEKVAAGGGVDGENIETLIVPVNGITEWLSNESALGHAIDPKIYVGLYHLTMMDIL